MSFYTCAEIINSAFIFVIDEGPGCQSFTSRECKFEEEQFLKYFEIQTRTHVFTSARKCTQCNFLVFAQPNSRLRGDEEIADHARLAKHMEITMLCN